MNQFSIFFFLLFFQLSVQAQPGPDDVPCPITHFNDFDQFVDTIDFRIECYSKIDFENEMCSWSFAEGNYNTVPIMNAKLLCVFYMENTIKSTEFEAIQMFDDKQYRKKYFNRIQMVFIYDPLTGFNGPYQTKKEIETLLNTNPRLGYAK